MSRGTFSHLWFFTEDFMKEKPVRVLISAAGGVGRGLTSISNGVGSLVSYSLPDTIIFIFSRLSVSLCSSFHSHFFLSSSYHPFVLFLCSSSSLDCFLLVHISFCPLLHLLFFFSFWVCSEQNIDFTQTDCETVPL